MASRLAVPKIPRLASDLAPRGWIEVGQRRMARVPRGAMLRRAVWRTVTAPYWLASDVPAPHLPRRDGRVPEAGLAGNHVAKLVQEIGRRIWVQRGLTIVARSLWLGVLAGTIWLLIDILGGPDLHYTPLIWIAVLLMIPGVLFAASVRPSRRQVARMLDQSFDLRERMTTAVENLGTNVPQPGERASMSYLQMADAANVVTELRRHSAFAIRPPVREIVMAIICALIFSCLYFARGVGADLPVLHVGAVPPFTLASERMVQQARTSAPTGATADAPTVAQVQERADRSNQARQDLDTLARALDDHAVTSPAADAMAQGDYPRAADELRDLADDAGNLSQSSRDALADDLDVAASQISPDGERLADATRQAAEGLRQGEQAAQTGVRNLGDAVEETGNNVVSQQELAQQMEQAEAAEDADQNSGSQGSQSQSSQSPQSSTSNGQNSAEPGSSDQVNGANEGGENSPGDDGSQGAATDPTERGEGGEVAEQSATSPEGEQSEGQTPGGQGAQASEPMEGQPQGQPGSSGEQSSDGQPGDSGSPDGGQTSDNPGDGAGSGVAPDDPARDGGAQPGDQSDVADGEAPAEANVAEGNGESGAGGETEGATVPREAISLSRAPEGESYQTNADGGGSNIGAGSGVSVSSGTSTQGEVGVAGPDSNRVPPGYRSAVEDYFSEADGS